jgi:Fe-S-cluster-containing hydrogenase component 2
MKTATPAATVTFRRLNPDAPVGVCADACLPLRSRHTECDRCAEACPAGVLHRGEETFFLDEGCLGCGRCAAVCPMGAIAVAGFALRPSKIKAPRPLTLDCWRVPTEASPSRSVRVPCFGGLSPGQWLGLALAAHGDAPAATSPAPPGHTACACCGPGVKLLDRGWCGACPANPGAAHPAAVALTVVHGWLKEARVPRQYWPWLARAPLPTARAVAPDPRNEAPVNRRNFFGALVHESVGLANAALDAPRAEKRHRKSGAGTRQEVAQGRAGYEAKDAIRSRGRKVPGAHAPVASPERERVLVFLAALAARHGGGVPASLYPAIAIDADCHHHCLCAALCPTGALRPYTDNDSVGIAYDAARCIACGQCESACPEHALHLQPAGPGMDAVVALTRHTTRTCAACGERFATNGRETHCPPCRKSRDFARAGFVTLYRDAGKRGARDKH